MGRPEWDGLAPYVKKVRLAGKNGPPSDYLTVPGRIAWFQHDAEAREGTTTIFTEPLLLDLERGEAVIRATVTDGAGNSASGIGWETRAEFDRGYVQKAETIAIGRALAMLGYNTQAALEQDFRDLPALADTPVERPGEEQRKTLAKQTLIRQAAQIGVTLTEDMTFGQMCLEVGKRIGADLAYAQRPSELSDAIRKAATAPAQEGEAQ